MNSKLIIHSDKGLEEIWDQVPADYYQNGVARNVLQKIWHTKKLKTVIGLIKSSNIKPKKILDVGSASGWFLSELALRYPKASYAGVDVHKKAINYGKKRYKNLKLICADAQSLPFPNESFDVVICTEVLEHVGNPEKVLTEIKRVLTSKGIAMVEMDTGNILFRLVWHWWTNIRKGVWRDSHIHAFNTKILEIMIKNSGFTITQKKVFNCSMAVIFMISK